MTSFDWDVVGLTAGLGAASFAAMAALRRRSAKRRMESVQIDRGSMRRRIDVVAIDESVGRSPEQERNP